MNQFIQTIKQQVEKRLTSMPHLPIEKPNTLDFCKGLLTKPAPAILAEIKFSSPSRGKIYPGTLDAVSIAKEYIEAGASALSILTEPFYFQGNIENIRLVRQAFPEIPILLKDFVLHEKQIRQALHYGANAVLLIASFLTEERLKTLFHYTLELGMTPLIEVHSTKELEFALTLKPRLLGINHRNLNTLQIDLDLSYQLLSTIPQGTTLIAESGIDTAKHLQTMVERGFHACLIGTSFMQHPQPGSALAQLLKEYSHAC